jgi:competence protein ComX
VQNSYFYVKIGLWILTTNFTKQVINKKERVMMIEIMQYLLDNRDVLDKVREGTACLIGVSSEELKAILEVFSADPLIQKAYYWM